MHLNEEGGSFYKVFVGEKSEQLFFNASLQRFW